MGQAFTVHAEAFRRQSSEVEWQGRRTQRPRPKALKPEAPDMSECRRIKTPTTPRADPEALSCWVLLPFPQLVSRGLAMRGLERFRGLGCGRVSGLVVSKQGCFSSRPLSPDLRSRSAFWVGLLIRFLIPGCSTEPNIRQHLGRV